MKYLQYESIENLNHRMCCVDTGDARIFTRIEAYSCKSTGEERKLKNHIDSKYDDNLNVSESEAHSLPKSYTKSPASPFGPLSQITSKKTLFYLLATLNSVYPDYDFSDVKPEAFTKVPGLSMITTRVSNSLLAHLGDPINTSQIGTSIWDAINQIVELQECDMYSFQPDKESEPDSEEGNLWSFYYFFLNRKLKRVVFFTARSVSLMAPIQPEEKGDVFLMEEGGDDGVMFEEEVFDRYGSNRALSYEQYTMQTMDI